MKRIILFAIAIIGLNYCFAQTDPQSTLALQVVVEDVVEPFPTAAKAQMQSKLSNILTKNGLQSCNWQNQFFITATVVPQTKDILPGPPTQIAEVMDVVFYIGDSYNEIVFSSTNQTVKGVGTTDAKCYLNAISNIKTSSTKLAEFIEEGKKKIVDYYNAQAPKMLLKAQSLCDMQTYDEAIWLLITIPSECTYYEQALAQGVAIYKEMLKNQCHQNLAAAKNAWMANYNQDGALEAAEYLTLITPESGCYEEAKELYNEIKSRMREDYDFEIRKYEDELKRHEDEVLLQKELINAMREVGVAFGENQKANETNIGFVK